MKNSESFDWILPIFYICCFSFSQEMGCFCRKQVEVEMRIEV